MSIVSKVFRDFYWPLCRAYARHLGDKSADELLRCLCSPQFWFVHRYWPNFVHPKSFNEKLWSRMLHDRNPILSMISDKLQVRDYAMTIVGDACLIPLLWSGEKPEEIPFDDLPLKFVIKTNHGCGYVIIVDNKTQLDQRKTIQQLKKWLNANFALDTFLGIAWGYKNIRPTIIIESFIEEEGKPPVDYKFYCFSGRVEFLTVHYDRWKVHKTRSLDRNFEPYDFRYGFDEWKGECRRPPNFDSMVIMAESLSKDFDFMRVDLYSLGNHIYFSELTPYPGGVSTKFLPLNRDYILGEKWK